MPKRLVQEIMNPNVICARPEMTVAEVAQMLAGRRVGGAPVVDGDGRVLGVITQNDIVRHGAKHLTVAEAGRFQSDVDDYRDLAQIPANLSSTPVEKVMSTPVYSVSRDASVAVAANIMRERRIHRVVVTESGRLVGMLSALDLMRVIEEV